MSTSLAPPVHPTFPIVATDFHPRRLLSNGHLQTIFGNFLPRPHHLAPPEAVLVEVEPASTRADGLRLPPSRVLCHCHWQPGANRAHALTVIVLHGLEGSSSSQYILGNTDKLLRSGCNVVRMNMRNCGGTEALSPTLYHSGLSSDVLAVLRFFSTREHLHRVALVGYSMGGNLVLRLAGELGAEPSTTAAAQCLCAVVGVSPVIDLAESADALHEPLNRLYERHFLCALTARFRRKAQLFPSLYSPQSANHLRSLRDFDDRVTAHYAGFTSSSDYYFRCSSARVVHHIRLPTLILHALDDPFIRLTPPTRATLLANPAITLLEPRHGGHCAFLATPEPDSGNDGYWAEHTLLRFLQQTCP